MITLRKAIKLLLVLLCCPLSGEAQQLPLFTQYSEYGGLINASHIHLNTYHFGHKNSVGVAYRDQWSQLPDRPRTSVISFESSTSYKKGINLIYGGYIMKDQIGVFQTTELQARIAGFFKTSTQRTKKSGISIGINLGAGQYRADLSELAYVNLDPILFRDNTAVIYPDIGVGISYLNEFDNKDYLQVGLSVPQIFGLDHSYTNDKKEFDVTRVSHYYLTTSYYKMLTDKQYLEFSGWVKHVNHLAINYDILIRYRFSKNMWLGAGANSSSIIHTEIGVIVDYAKSGEFRFGYSFNPTFYSHSVIFGNIHELSLSYSFGSY